MEESFKVRVEKLFGSHLFETVPKSSFPNSSWSVSEGEVEKREWNRERGVDPGREDIPCASSYDDNGGDGCFARKGRESRRKKLLEDDLDDLDDDDDEEEEEEDEEEGGGGAEVGEEERDIRASIGLDSTLDREDEEDEYDMAAVFKEKINDRVYMSDVADHGPYINYHSVVVEDFNEVVHKYDKDPRADHLAANARLREDEKAGENVHSVTGGDDTLMVNSQSKTTRADANLKPILKRKENHEDLRPKKHVRFDSSIGDDRNDESKHSLEVVEATTTSAATVTEAGSRPESSPGIPDYIRNPSKYVCYSFDASDVMDNKSNRQAFEDFQNMVKKAQPTELEAGSVELPKSVTFTPRKKAADAMMTENSPAIGNEDGNKDSEGVVVRSIGVAAEDVQESEACAMEEDIMVEGKCGVSRRADRKYRSRSSSDDSAF